VDGCCAQRSAAAGALLTPVFSSDTDDEVFGTLYFDDGKTAQVSVNWSDESFRKMTTKITIWGTAGRIYADRQECQVFLRDNAKIPEGYKPGWNVRYTTELTEPVWFYIRGEEYSAQLDHFARCVEARASGNENSFGDAVMTDRVISMIIADAQAGTRTSAHAAAAAAAAAAPRRRRGLFFGAR